MLDRIDIHIEVPALPFDKLDSSDSEPSEDIRKRVEDAQAIQKKRFRGHSVRTNSEMGLKEIKQFIPVNDTLKPVLKLAHERYRLSARAYHRVLKLARTIADLRKSPNIEPDHLAEALQYRPKIEN